LCFFRQGRECHILLQNENGPCPLIAAANCILLTEQISLPAAAIRNNVASLSDLTNVLANFALNASHSGLDASAGKGTTTGTTGDTSHNSSFQLHELLEQIPPLQYGMDVNPKFTDGIHGYEYTSQLNCFDMWKVRVCHGWLLDPQETSEELYAAIANKTYNQVIDFVIHGKEAEQSLASLATEIAGLEQQGTVGRPVADLLDDDSAPSHPSPEAAAAASETLHELRIRHADAANKATIASWIDHFLQSTAHQLTQHGLHCLHADLAEKSMGIFFRNNHFATITKQEGLLYLLVTDLGYAHTPQIVWEKLDMINGDTEHVNATFCTPGQVSQTAGASLSPEMLLAQSGQKDADYHLALHISMNPNGMADTSSLDTREGELMAAATQASLREYNGVVGPTEPVAAVGVPLGPMSTSGGTVVALPPAAAMDTTCTHTPTDADRFLALQLAQEGQPQGSGSAAAYDDMASLRLAQQLQAEENQRATTTRPTGRRRTAPATTRRVAAREGATSSNCVIS
jgi:hypothetical protein